MTLRERIAVLIERETGLGGKDSQAVTDAILQAVEESLPEKDESDEALCECQYLQCQCGGWNAYREAVRKVLR